MYRRLARYVAVASLLLTIAFAYFVVWPFVEFKRMKKDYPLTTQGMSKGDVLAIMAPNESRRYSFATHNRPVRWDERSLGGGTELGLTSVEAYGVQTYYLPLVCEFMFDANDRLIGRRIYD